MSLDNLEVGCEAEKKAEGTETFEVEVKDHTRVIDEENSGAEKAVPKKGKNLKMAIAIGLVFVAAVAIWLSFFSLDSNEKIALEYIEDYQKMLKDPDSLVLRSDIIYIWTGDEGLDFYYYFTASANNSFGAPVTATEVMHNRKYLCSVEEFDAVLDTPVREWDETTIEISRAHRLFYEWLAYGENMCEQDDTVVSAMLIDGTKIARRLGVRSDID